MAEQQIHLKPDELAVRWGYSVRTLANWRAAGTGPEYVRVGPRRVLYPLDSVIRWESEHITAQPA